MTDLKAVPADGIVTPTIDTLKQSKKHYDNALGIICHSEFIGHQAGDVYATLRFLQNLRDQIAAQIEKLEPESPAPVDPVA